MKKHLLVTLLLLSANALAINEPVCVHDLYRASTKDHDATVKICELDNGELRYSITDDITKTGVLFVDAKKDTAHYRVERDGYTVTYGLNIEHDDVVYDISSGIDSYKDAFAISTIVSGGEVHQEYVLDPSTVVHVVDENMYKRGFSEELPD